MNPDHDTLKDLYNRAAVSYAAKYASMGARERDIDKVFSLCNKQNPFVYEIGCADGRDAQYIIRKTKNYLGIDISEKFIEMARVRLPSAIFEVADLQERIPPNNIDIVIAFASLLHLDKLKLENVFNKLHCSLHDSGLVFISLKRREVYQSDELVDEFGKRIFYFYTRSDLEKMIGNKFTIEFYNEQERTENWLSAIVRKS